MRNNQHQQVALSHVDDTISTLLNNAAVMDDNILRINHELCSYQNSLDVQIQEFSAAKELAEENEHDLNIIGTSCHLLNQEIHSLKQRLEERHVVSVDGTLLWKISDI